MRKSDAANNRRLPRYLLMAGMVFGLVSQAATADVLTARLDWQAVSVETGLDRLKEHFLDVSIREDTEFVGAVLKNENGSFEFTQGHGKPGQDRVSFRIQRPAGTEIVGLWHTHGAQGPMRNVFSPTDAELVRRTGLPFYLITPDGEVRVLRPEHVDGQAAGVRVKGTMSRLPRGSHPGERVNGRQGEHQAPRGCTDVIKV